MQYLRNLPIKAINFFSYFFFFFRFFWFRDMSIWIQFIHASLTPRAHTNIRRHFSFPRHKEMRKQGKNPGCPKDHRFAELVWPEGGQRSRTRKWARRRGFIAAPKYPPLWLAMRAPLRVLPTHMRLSSEISFSSLRLIPYSFLPSDMHTCKRARVAFFHRALYNRRLHVTRGITI